jgi:glycerophosphoryl diester phosphodiesterase
VRNHIRTLCAACVALSALVFTAQIADADSMEEITVGHRGAATSQLGEGTLPAYAYAVKNHADMLDGDVRWTKDGPDTDNVGTIVILHDATLDRISNCTGTVSSWLWSAIRDRCRTKVGGQKLMRLVDLLRYGNSVGESFALEIKVSPITDAQANQL